MAVIDGTSFAPLATKMCQLDFSKYFFMLDHLNGLFYLIQLILYLFVYHGVQSIDIE